VAAGDAAAATSAAAGARCSVRLHMDRSCDTVPAKSVLWRHTHTHTHTRSQVNVHVVAAQRKRGVAQVEQCVVSFKQM
jgi:hypothetical protein